MSKRLTVPREDWLAENHPALFHTIHALDGDRKAQQWLEANAAGLYHLARAMTGQEAATAELASLDPAERGLLVEIMDSDDLLERLRARHPLVQQLLLAGKGDAAARRQLPRQKALARLADVLRALYEGRQAEESGTNPQELTGGAAADVGVLVAELHLRKGEYDRAIAAFTRVLEVEPTAEAYDGRARAYHGLAEQDEQRAARLRR